MEFDTVYTRVCSWCCEIAVGTKISNMISWKVMFFKCEKSRMENFLCSHNVLERNASSSSHWNPLIYTKESGPIFLRVTYYPNYQV